MTLKKVLVLSAFVLSAQSGFARTEAVYIQPYEQSVEREVVFGGGGHTVPTPFDTSRPNQALEFADQGLYDLSGEIVFLPDLNGAPFLVLEKTKYRPLAHTVYPLVGNHNFKPWNHSKVTLYCRAHAAVDQTGKFGIALETLYGLDTQVSRKAYPWFLRAIPVTE